MEVSNIKTDYQRCREVELNSVELRVMLSCLEKKHPYTAHQKTFSSKNVLFENTDIKKMSVL